jgi:flagellar hook-associated protein 1 FlgK
MALSVGLDVARSSLAATAEQLAVISRNISRASDPSASRKSAPATTGPGGLIVVERIGRGYDAQLLDKLLTSNSSSEGQKVVRSALDQLHQTIDDTDLQRSPGALIGKLNDALQRYSATPNSTALAGAVVSAAKDLTNALNGASKAILAVRQQADKDISNSVSNINDLLQKFSALNKEVVDCTRTGRDGTDAADARDKVLTDLSKEIGIRTISRNSGDLAIFTESGVTLFDIVPRPANFVPGTGLTSGQPGASVYVDGVPVVGTPQLMSVRNGKLAGLVAVRDELAPVYEAQMDEIARGLVEAFAETDQSSSPTRPPAAGLFSYSGAPAVPPVGTLLDGLAGTIFVNPNADPNQGGNSLRIRDGGISNPGNPSYIYNSSASGAYSDRIQDLIAKLDTPRSFDGVSQIETSATLADFSRSSASWLETTRQTASSEADYREVVSKRAQSALSSATGVNLDDELSRMLEIERTYQASARLLTAIDSLVGSLMDAMR